MQGEISVKQLHYNKQIRTLIRHMRLVRDCKRNLSWCGVENRFSTVHYRSSCNSYDVSARLASCGLQPLMDVVTVRWMSLEWQRRIWYIWEFRRGGKLSWTGNVVISSVGMSAVVRHVSMCSQRAQSSERLKYIIAVLRCSCLRNGSPRG